MVVAARVWKPVEDRPEPPLLSAPALDELDALGTWCSLDGSICNVLVEDAAFGGYAGSVDESAHAEFPCQVISSRVMRATARANTAEERRDIIRADEEMDIELQTPRLYASL